TSVMPSNPAVVRPRQSGVAVWVAVHHRAPPSRKDRSVALVQLEPIRTTATRAADAVRVRALPGFKSPSLRRAAFRWSLPGAAFQRAAVLTGGEPAGTLPDQRLHRDPRDPGGGAW